MRYPNLTIAAVLLALLAAFFFAPGACDGDPPIIVDRVYGPHDNVPTVGYSPPPASAPR